MTRAGSLRRAWAPALVGALLAAGAGVAPPAAAAPAPAAATTTPAAAAPPRPTDPIAHDPTIAREGDWYYVAITGDAAADGAYLPMKRSKDLVHWQELDPVLTELPREVTDTLGVVPEDAWAPDLSFVDGEWRLYYAASQFGTTNSVIALATTPTLDPAGVHWTDEGIVVRSAPGSDVNAIDPAFTTDAAGNGWLSYGSFFGGVVVTPVDLATGKPAAGDVPVKIAQRAAPDAEENSQVVRHGDWYYLFLSFDFCCRSVESDYRTVVGRSRSITGPYLDAAGAPLLGKGGTELVRGYNEFAGAGGADVLVTGGATDLLVNHYYDTTDGGAPRLNVRTVSWADGWPSVSEPVNPSRTVGHGDAYVEILPRAAGTVVEDAGCGYEGAALRLGTERGDLCQQWQVSDRGNGSRLTNRFSNLVAEVAACAQGDSARVAQWGWVGFLPDNDCQRWTFAAAADGYTTVSSLTAGSRAWTVQGAPTAGAGVVVSTPTGAAPQQFRFAPVGKVLLGSPTDGTRTLGPADCSTTGGTGALFGPRSTAGCQEWTVAQAAGATYTVTNAATGLQLAAARCGDTPATGGLRAVRPTPSSSPCRTWTLRPGNDGTWSLGNSATGAVQEVELLVP